MHSHLAVHTAEVAPVVEVLHSRIAAEVVSIARQLQMCSGPRSQSSNVPAGSHRTAAEAASVGNPGCMAAAERPEADIRTVVAVVWHSPSASPHCPSVVLYVGTHGGP